MESEETKKGPTRRLYVLVWGALVILTGLTVLSAELHLGNISTGVSIAIASTKASLVLLFFMHLKYEPAVFRYTFIATICTLAIFIILTYSDILNR